MDFSKLEVLLKKQLSYGYSWGKKQDNSWDYKTNFIYKISSFEHLLEKCDSEGFSVELRNYAVNRWLNFQSAKAIESMFTSHNLVKKKKTYTINQ